MQYRPEDLLLVSASLCKVKPLQLKQMLDDNQHNKQTTVYWLLMKRVERGDLDLA